MGKGFRVTPTIVWFCFVLVICNMFKAVVHRCISMVYSSKCAIMSCIILCTFKHDVYFGNKISIYLYKFFAKRSLCADV